MSTARLIDRVVMAVAWRLPRRFIYWCAIRLIAHATTGRHRDVEVPALTAMDALGAWEE